MTEIKKTLQILEARWREVALIIPLFVLVDLSGDFLRVKKDEFSVALFALYVCFGVSIAVISQLFYCGFLRTASLQGQTPQPPRVLFKVGAHFFWRVFGFLLPCLVAYSFLFYIILYGFTYLEHRAASEFFFKLYLWCVPISETLALIILVKPLLFIPAIIIVLDCSFFMSWKYLRKCKLLDAKELLMLLLLLIIRLFLNKFIKPMEFARTIADYSQIIIFNVIFSFLSLSIYIVAVRFIASQNLLQDKAAAPQAFENEDSEG